MPRLPPNGATAYQAAAEANPGVDVSADFTEYCCSLGIDPECEEDEDLLCIAQEAFDAVLPIGWAEYMHDDGRVYYFNQQSNQSTWEHPMDGVYRELIQLIQQVRAAAPGRENRNRVGMIRQHLDEVNTRAKKAIKAWSGPYRTDEGIEYYYNEALQLSSWDSPTADWELQLHLRHSVLCRCLLPDKSKQPSAGLGAEEGFGDVAELLEALQLPADLMRRDGVGSAKLPSTASYHTARSCASTTRSSRSGRTKKEKRLPSGDTGSSADGARAPAPR